MEVWKDIEGYGNRYQVSSEGRIRKKNKDKRSRPFRYLTPNCNNNAGYYRVGLSYKCYHKTLTVHRLVAQAFIPNPNNKPQVNHIDGNKKNNRVENLEWVTVSENGIHASKTGLLDSMIAKASKAVCQFNLDGELLTRWDSFHQIERETGLRASYICRKCKGNGYAYGYYWGYADERI